LRQRVFALAQNCIAASANALSKFILWQSRSNSHCQLARLDAYSLASARLDTRHPALIDNVNVFNPEPGHQQGPKQPGSPARITLHQINHGKLYGGSACFFSDASSQMQARSV
jgi:hypothetical protein